MNQKYKNFTSEENSFITKFDKLGGQSSKRTSDSSILEQKSIDADNQNDQRQSIECELIKNTQNLNEKVKLISNHNLEKINNNDQKINLLRSKLQEVYNIYKEDSEQFERAKKKVARLTHLRQQNRNLQTQILKVKNMIKSALLLRQKQKMSNVSR